MDIDSRIKWEPGMELSARTFKELDRNLDFRQQVAVRAALGGDRMGLVPGEEFRSKGVFVKNTFEIEDFRCMAVLPSGRILSADEKVEVTIPMLFGEEYYLTVAPGTEDRTFEREGVPYEGTSKVYSIRALDELGREDLFPVARFKAAGGVFSVDPDFIPPCLLLDGDARFAEYGASFTEKLKAICEHPNLEEGDGKRTMLRYLFQFKGYLWNGGVREFVQLTQEMAQAVDYYIMSPNSESPVQIPAPNMYDIQKWLGWLSEYLSGAVSVLDNVVLEDNSIDYEALLAQAKAELYERLNPELREALLMQIKEELREELREQLTSKLMNYVDGDIKPGLHDTLSSELDPSLHDRLYPELYDALFKALYVPEQEEAEFYPMM